MTGNPLRAMCVLVLILVPLTSHSAAAAPLLFLHADAQATQPAASPVQQPTPVPAQQEPVPAATQPTEREVKPFTLSPERYEKAVAYSRMGYILYFVGVVYGFGVLLLVLSRGWAGRIRDLAERASRRRFVQALVFTPLLLLTVDVLSLPLSAARQWIERRFELSVQSWGSWLWDWAKGELVGFVLGTLLVWLLFAVIRRSPRRWWLYGWLGSLPVIVFLLFLTPVVIAPLFDKFEPLAETQPGLVAQIQKVVQRGGMDIPPERMFEMKASEKVRTLNAYVTGVGASKRVVVWDTTIQKMSTDQTLFVFGHEMGHYVLGHIPKLIVMIAAVLLVMLFLAHRLLPRLLARWGQQWMVRAPDDWAALPVLLVLLTVLGFAATPILSTNSRMIEHEADIYGLEVIHGLVPDSGRVAGEAFQILGEVGLSDPDPNPFIEFWLYSHPALVDRVVFAQTYDPWAAGQSPRFVR